jgi:mono/diheme cytochrome c family protein
MFVRPLLPVLSLASMLAVTAVTAEETGGRDLYMTFQCWQCHGYEGQGGPAARIASKEYSYEVFTRFVRFPNLMPAYPRELLGDEALRRIFEYVRAIPEPPALEDVPALRDNQKLP